MAPTNERHKEDPIPLYAKTGWVLAWGTMLVVAAMMLRNCAASVYYGLRTNKSQVESAYQTGRKDGEDGQGPKFSADLTANPVLHKSYTKGYRDGLDHRQSHPASPPAPPDKTSPTPATPPSSPPPAATYADFSDFDLSGPDQAVISFVQLFNGIMPVSPPADLTKICAKSAAESYQTKCVQLLQGRVNLLKKIAIKLKGAQFAYQPLVKLSLNDGQGQFQAVWKETFTFFDQTTQVNDQKMVVDLQRIGKEWRVTGVRE